MISVIVNDKEYGADVLGMSRDRDWDDRESKVIHLEMDYDTANKTFVDGTTWKIKNVITEDLVEEYDNSDFSVRGDLTVHTDGTVSVKMGKPTELEIAYELLYGGIK